MLGKNKPRTTAEVIDDIKAHPENHKHSFKELMVCCAINGAIDSALLDAHQKYLDLGTNAGIRCDTIDGPCACGAWHFLDEKDEK